MIEIVIFNDLGKVAVGDVPYRVYTRETNRETKRFGMLISSIHLCGDGTIELGNGDGIGREIYLPLMGVGRVLPWV